MLWPAFMLEARDFLRLRKTSSFCNTGREKSPSSPLQSINRGHILLEAGEMGSWGDAGFPGSGPCNHTPSSQQQTLSAYELRTPPSCQHCKN